MTLRDTLFDSSRCFVIAEAGVNHNGDPETALELVDAAAETGADAVKFQTFRADLLVQPDAPKARYQEETTGADETQHEMLRGLELPLPAYEALKARAEERGLIFMSTPFDEESVDLLDDLGMQAFKIGSGELTNLDLLRAVARKRKPIILSTGMASLGEVEQAIDAVTSQGNEDIVLLHCVSNYPTEASDVNLRALGTMRTAFGRPVGFSDHTMGIEVALAAVALGAVVVEKHFTLDHNADGPDHRLSLEPGDMTRLVQGILKVESALGDGIKRPAASEADVRAVARRSLVVSTDLPAGATLRADVLVVRRPGTGLAPALKPYVVGRRLRVRVAAGTMLTLEMLD